MKEVEDHIYELIAGALNDELTAGEARELHEWLEASGEHRAVMEREREIHLLARSARDCRVVDVERALRAVKRRRRGAPWRSPPCRGRRSTRGRCSS